MPDRWKPTTADMRIAFAKCYIPGDSVVELAALFDEWFASVQAEAWERGWGSAMLTPYHKVNPYRPVREGGTDD